MTVDPKAAEARKHVEEMLKKMASHKPETAKLAAVIGQGNALKNDKETD